ncbi:hypothetical protein ACD578_00625 [Microvirga sp. RSM25]|uniref:hypothetical protein n=1 Tax=Microvirga sp. RSM25 TaxID=3273802 RepID=UPI0038507164
MPPANPEIADDPFEGLYLPVSAWKALEEAHITSLEQLKTMVPVIEQIHGIGPEMAQVIRDRVELLATRRIVRVRLIFPKRSHREK